MSVAKTALEEELNICSARAVESSSILSNTDRPSVEHTEFSKPRGIASSQASAGSQESLYQFPTRPPVIVGEAAYRGWLPIDGVISGQPGGSGNGLSIRQRRRNGTTESEPELHGELRFKEMLRVNGHVAGRICSERGTLIVASDARVDADIEVGIVTISGTVNGNIVGFERVELGPGAVIVGSIVAGSLEVRPGAVFHGKCSMLTTNGNTSK